VEEEIRGAVWKWVTKVHVGDIVHNEVARERLHLIFWLFCVTIRVHHGEKQGGEDV